MIPFAVLDRQRDPLSPIAMAQAILRVCLVGKSYLVGTNAIRALLVEEEYVEGPIRENVREGPKELAENIESLLLAARNGSHSIVRIAEVKRWAGDPEWAILNDCPACAGRGSRVCYACAGARTQSFPIEGGGTEDLPCETCEGKGVLTCRTCKGQGSKPAKPEARTGAIGACLIDRNLVAQLFADVDDKTAVLVRVLHPENGTLFLGEKWIGVVMPMREGARLIEDAPHLEDVPGVFGRTAESQAA